MHVNYSYSEIYQYLVSRGHGLSNESVLKEPENNANVIWGIFVALSKVVESSHIKSTFTLLSHEIEEP